MSRCPNCHHAIDANHHYCPNCGIQLSLQEVVKSTPKKEIMDYVMMIFVILYHLVVFLLKAIGIMIAFIISIFVHLLK